MNIRAARTKVWQGTRLPKAPNGSATANVSRERFLGQAFQGDKINGFGWPPQNRIARACLQIANQRAQCVKARLCLAPIEMRQRRKTVLFNGEDFFLSELGDYAGSASLAAANARQSAKGSVALMAASAACDLRHFGRG